MSDSLSYQVVQYLQTLEQSAYDGEIFTDTSTRLINATDNSIYQILPQAVLAPRTQEDLICLVEVAQQYSDIAFMARGGGTGTNGQSLNDCIIVDTSKYLTDILEINTQEGWVRVQPGVVLAQLNKALESHDLFFPPYISPAKSATLGGMVSTDACGKGSRAYGKTSDYIMNIECVLADGRVIQTRDYDDQKLNDLIAQHYDDAVQGMPHLPRGISGYNLQAYDPSTEILDMNKLIAGSEGSLALIREIKLRVVPKPAHRVMFCIAYESFDVGLRHVMSLLTHDPVAIETIDDRILELARGDILWHDVKSILPEGVATENIKAIHFVEFESHDQMSLQVVQNDFEAFLKKSDQHLGHVFLMEQRLISQASALRSKCVGLLGNMDGLRRPLPFMEDTAVPPENLADYILDLKCLLTEYDLESGAFGHVDAGCLHVRPALDLRQLNDEALIRELSDKVVVLLQKYGGVLWGEHGKGMRAEYVSTLLGTAYHDAMQVIKMYFDPGNRFNPGKIAVSEGHELRHIDDVPLRGHFDRHITDDVLQGFEKSIQCNGNAQCFSAMSDEMMCPSYKVTRDRRHSPKGRAGLLREWLRLKSVSPYKARSFEPELYEVMAGCLSCKACTSVCPIHVNIPDMKASFLAQYFKRRLRPFRDYLVAYSEIFAHWQSYVPFPLPSAFGLVDMPKPSRPTLRNLMKRGGFKFAKPNMSMSDKAVLIVQDIYTSTYNAPVVFATLELIRKLGFEPYVLTFCQSGKTWHVMGFLDQFKKIAKHNTAYYKQFTAPLVGIDPSISLIYRDEYKGLDIDLDVLLIHEWLDLHVGEDLNLSLKTQDTYKLFLHCTESTMVPNASKNWQDLFQRFGLHLDVVQTGCCGMAGAYGHLKENRENSYNLYEMSWRGGIDTNALVTGYSCRSQVKRCEDVIAKHPVQILNQLL